MSPVSPTRPTHASLRVLYVIPGEEHGIDMPFSRRQAVSVRRQGVDVRSFFLRSRTSPLTVLREWLRLRAEIRNFQPHLVHAHYGSMTAFVAACASNVPLVITFHGSDLNPVPGDRRLKVLFGHFLSHLAARRASQIICVSPQLVGRLSQVADRVHDVPCGVNLELFRPMSRDECRRALGWDADEKVVLFNARTDPIGKRLDLAEAAARAAKLQINNLRLHVFVGKTDPDQMPLYYNAADCLLMTSDFEGSPMVVKEALACNLPVVSVDVGDVRARLEGVTPSAIVARDPQPLADALVNVVHVNTPSNGRDAIRPYDEEAAARRVVEIYRLAADHEHFNERELITVTPVLHSTLATAS
jgi:teichuronic acid biosynthesis glycosyltransferase TuaC